MLHHKTYIRKRQRRQHISINSHKLNRMNSKCTYLNSHYPFIVGYKQFKIDYVPCIKRNKHFNLGTLMHYNKCYFAWKRNSKHIFTTIISITKASKYVISTFKNKIILVRKYAVWYLYESSSAQRNAITALVRHGRNANHTDLDIYV